MEFDFRFGGGGKRPAPGGGTEGPMRILVMGDFSGRRNRGEMETGTALSERAPLAVDVDNVEKVMTRLAPRLALAPGGSGRPALSLEFGRLEDFHPDELYRKLDLFQALREMRRRLEDPATFAAAAAELRGSSRTGSAGAAPGGSPTAASSRAPDENDASTVERLLGRGPVGASTGAPRLAGGNVDITGFLRDIVAPYVTPGPDPFQPQYVAWVDEATADQMRGVIHDPAFQALEAAWRSLYFLVSRLDLGEELKLYVLDVSQAELAADLRVENGDLSRSGLYRMLVEQDAKTLGGRPWALLAGCFTFGSSPEDLSLLAALGAVGSRAGGPFIGEAHPSLVGCGSLAAAPDPADWPPLDPDFEALWRTLRASPLAPWIGLALPRFLLRLPYGKLTDPVERFAFEELAPQQDHESYLWGNPALACAMLIGGARLEKGPDMEPGDLLDIEDLPAHTWQEGDASRMKPCTEALLGERAVGALLTRGLIPLLSGRNSNRARVARFQSIADPPAPLSGPWRQD
jgi:type VI secretion system protein ImpC